MSRGLVEELEEFIGELEMRCTEARDWSGADTILASVLGTVHEMAVRARGGDEGPVARAEAIRAVRRGAARGRVLWNVRNWKPKAPADLVDAAMEPHDGHILAEDAGGEERKATANAVSELRDRGRVVIRDGEVHAVKEETANV